MFSILHIHVSVTTVEEADGTVQTRDMRWLPYEGSIAVPCAQTLCHNLSCFVETVMSVVRFWPCVRQARCSFS